MKKILFIVNGLGMGNSTRCESIIKPLIEKGFDIDVLTSGNGILYFENCPYVSKRYEFDSLYYGTKHGELSIWHTVFAVPNFIEIVFRNVRFVRNLLRSNNYSGVVIDSDYTMFWLKPWVKVPVFALNNADVVVRECRNLARIPRAIRMQYWLERCDYWYHQKVPDVVLSPTINFRDSQHRKTFKHFSPFVRDGLSVRPSEAGLKTILVMLSGSQFGTSTDFLKRFKKKDGVQIHVVGREGESNDWITFHGRIYQNRDIVNRADLMVINGGFSAVSEAVVLRKPAVVIPVPNHAEQFINALTVERAGLGLAANMDDVVDKIHEVLDRFPEFVEAHRLFNCPTDGAALAAGCIGAEINARSELERFRTPPVLES